MQVGENYLSSKCQDLSELALSIFYRIRICYAALKAAIPPWFKWKT